MATRLLRALNKDTMFLILWQWKKDPNTLLLYPDIAGSPFPGSETFAADWQAIASFQVYSGLKRPLPPGTDLYVAERQPKFPYGTTQIRKANNWFYPQLSTETYTAVSDSDVPIHAIYFVASKATLSHLSDYGLSII